MLHLNGRVIGAATAADDLIHSRLLLNGLLDEIPMSISESYIWTLFDEGFQLLLVVENGVGP